MRVLSPLNRRYLAIVLTMVFMVSFAFFVSPVNASTTTLHPVADSYVDSQYPNSNYGSQNTLRTRTNSISRRAYIKFDLTSLPAGQSISSAILKLYCTAASPSSNVELDVYATGDSWSELTITWNNAPPVGALIVINTAVGGTGIWHSWDITSYVAEQFSGDKIASVVVKFPLDCVYYRDYYSKEKYGTTYDPRLEISTAQQYYLTVSSPYDSPTPTSGWFASGTPVTASVTSPVAGPAGTRYVCTGWTGTGDVPASGSGTSVSFTVTQTSSITWNWKTQYLLTVLTSPGGLNPQPTRNPSGEAESSSSWWYDASVSVTLTAQSVTGYTFNYWDVDGGSQGNGINPIFVTMLNAPHTATAHYSVQIPQYYMTVSSSYGSPSPTSGWFASGTPVTASVTSPLSGPSGTQYVCTGWTGTGDVPASGSGTSVSFTITQTSSITWNWKTQYYLTVSSSYDSPTPTSGWFDAGTSIPASVTSPIPGPADTQYVCTGWTGTGSVPASGTETSISFDINAPSSIIWNWKTQYYLIVISSYGVTGGQGWYDSGATAYASVTPLTVPGSSGVQYVFTHWGGDASGTTSPSDPILMDGPKTATANWKTQYYLTVSSSHGTTGGEGWYDSGATAYASVTPLTVPGSSGVQYVFTHWGGDASGTTSPSDPILMDGPKTATANWKTQYYLTVSSSHGTTGGEGWYDSGATAYASVTPLTVPGSSGVQYVFTHWGGDASGTTSPSDPILMSGPKTTMANWKTQYYFDVISAYDSPTPPEGWYDAGTPITASVTSPVAGPAGTRYVCTGWTGTGDVPASGSETSISFTITVPSSITWNWKTQYLLTVLTSPGGLNPQPTRNPTGEAESPSSWWYDATSVTLTAQSITDYTFNYWDVDGGSQGAGVNPISVSMNAPHTATAHYTVQTLEYYLTVTSAYDSPTPTSGLFAAESSITASVTSPWPISPSGTRYVCTGWTGTGSVPSSGTTTSVTFTITQDSSITWNWKTQYYLTLATNPSGVAVPSGAGWHNSSTYASISTPEFVDIVPGSSRYKFNGWTTPDMTEITNPSALSTTVHMDKAKTVTANYIVQYYFTVSSPSHSPPCGSPIPPPPGEWVDAGTSITASVTSPWPGPTGTRYVCTGWTGTGSVPPIGTETSVTFTLDEPSSITWNWKTQYLLTVLISPSGLSPQPTRNPAGEAGPLNGYWYDASVSVTLTAQSVTGYTFNNWDVDGGSQGAGVNPISVSMNAPHTATAHYKAIPPSHPVGGYSVSLVPPAETAPVIGYAMILAIFSAVMALIRRKRK